MRLAFVTHSLSRHAGGLFPIVRRLAQTLSETPEMHVSVAGLHDEAYPQDAGAWAPLEPAAFPIVGPRGLGYTPRLGPWLDHVSPDITHCHGIWMHPSRACLRYRRKTGRPHVVSPQGMLDPWALRNSAWKKRIAAVLYENAHLREASCIHALAAPEAKAIRDFGLSNPICVIPNGVDLPTSTPTESAPWSHQVPPHRKVLLFLGRIHPKKGLPALVDAWKKFTGTDTWTLVIAGWDQGGHEQALREEAPADSVHFAGPLFGAAKSAALHHADAFILPSLSEGLPMAVLEAWSHSKPVLMTHACNLSEGFTAGAAIEIRSAAEALDQLAALSPSDRATMGHRGLELVEKNFQWLRIAARWEAVYRWLLKEGPQPHDVQLP